MDVPDRHTRLKHAVTKEVRSVGVFSESVDVSCTPSGQPSRLRWNGQDYEVNGEPLRWYERRQWWVEEHRAPLGSGPGLVDHEIWRVQVTRTGASSDPSGQDCLTLDLVRHLGSGRWRLLRIHDALRSTPPESRTA